MDTEKKAGGSKTSIKVGIWGGHGGIGWDDGSFHGVREITLIYDRCIDSIQVEYDKNGKSVLAEKHGGNGGNYTAHVSNTERLLFLIAFQIKLQYPEEFLTAISGYYSPVVSGGPPVIRSLTFKSNKKTFGPYGVEEGTPFIYQIEEGRIVGFRGRSGWYLDAISFHVSGHRIVSSFCDMVHQKIKKLGAMTTKSLGYHNNDQHALHGKAT